MIKNIYYALITFTLTLMFFTENIKAHPCSGPITPACPPSGIIQGCSPRDGCISTAKNSLLGSTDCEPIVSYKDTGDKYPFTCIIDGELGHVNLEVYDEYETAQSYNQGLCWYDDDTINCQKCSDKTSTIWKSVNYGATTATGKSCGFGIGQCIPGMVA